MTSERQIAANKLNAKKGTGPRTLAGKTKVSANAFKHGLTARSVVLPGEDPDDFERFSADLMTSLDPRNALEYALAEMIVSNVWRLRRIPKFEALLHRHGSAKLLVSRAEKLVVQYESTEKDRVLASLEKKKVAARDRQAHDEAEQRLAVERAQLDEPSFNVARVLETLPEPLMNLWRHEAALGRALLRNMHELERLQAKRAGKHVPVPAVVDVDVSVAELASADIEGTRPGRETTKVNTGKAIGLTDQNLQNKAIDAQIGSNHERQLAGSLSTRPCPAIPARPVTPPQPV
jgi:hypothetical protein